MAHEITYNNFEILLMVFMPNIKKLLEEVFVISRIIKVQIGVINRSRRLRLITLTETLIILAQKPNLTIVLLYIERILSFSLRHKMFSKFVPTLSLFVPTLFFDSHLRSEALLKFEGYNDVQITTLFLNWLPTVT